MPVLTSHSFSFLSSSFPSPSLRRIHSPPTPTTPSSARASMGSPVASFPYLPPANRNLMLDLLAAVDRRLNPSLLPSTVPPGVLLFQNPQGSSHGSVDIRSGSPSSSVDFVLKSWLHCKLPGPGEMNTASLSAFLNSSTDAPHLMVELIQGGPASLVLVIDLLPRRDLVLHPDYLEEFYQLTDLDSPRRDLEELRLVSPYRSPSLFVRSILSPTAVALTVDCGEEAAAMERIISGEVGAAAKKAVAVWLERCAGGGGRPVVEEEREALERRDGLIKRKIVETDLVANLPRMFGTEVAERVVGEIQKVFRV
ncbi:Red chlorophyll catabolite reductase, chloroplastic [Apostasia shenzhenica]|uniref:Red chlorophyll catabolite reductase, chloroplastic n=1 Tax=Apostasia shenzhenica TaxID=1088818 RepID=A0A2I0B7J9_9ASPA|nr:Red chlorophyll catabolite reductase, chloroplastic [Apostasia shenzhenica]